MRVKECFGRRCSADSRFETPVRTRGESLGPRCEQVGGEHGCDGLRRLSERRRVLVFRSHFAVVMPMDRTRQDHGSVTVFCVMVLRVLPRCVMPRCVMPRCVMPRCVMPRGVVLCDVKADHQGTEGGDCPQHREGESQGTVGDRTAHRFQCCRNHRLCQDRFLERIGIRAECLPHPVIFSVMSIQDRFVLPSAAN